MHSVHFQEQGLEITGMDNSSLALKICMEKGMNNTLISDMLHLDDSIIHNLDSIFMWGNNFGLLQNQTLARRFFKNCLKMRNENAIILVETINPYGKAFFMDDDLSFIAENKLNDRLGGQIRVRVRYRFYTLERLSFCLKRGIE